VAIVVARNWSVRGAPACVLAFAALLSGCGPAPTISVDGRDRTCGADAECVVVFDGDVCADQCNNDKAINADAFIEYSRELDEKLADHPCDAFSSFLGISADCGVFFVPRCVDGLCTPVSNQ
jgi:hypothetical protein